VRLIAKEGATILNGFDTLVVSSKTGGVETTLGSGSRS
jgi:hypothetical protein